MQRTDITAIFPDATAEQIQKIMDLNGGDINKAKEGLTALQGQLATVTKELEGLKAKPGADAAQLAAVQKELNDLKQANSLRDLREKVSKETGVPASLLTGETEDACKAQAAAINDFAKPGGYPNLRDGGEAGAPPANATRDKFAQWFNDNMGK